MCTEDARQSPLGARAVLADVTSVRRPFLPQHRQRVRAQAPLDRRNSSTAAGAALHFTQVARNLGELSAFNYPPPLATGRILGLAGGSGTFSRRFNRATRSSDIAAGSCWEARGGAAGMLPAVSDSRNPHIREFVGRKEMRISRGMRSEPRRWWIRSSTGGFVGKSLRGVSVNLRRTLTEGLRWKNVCAR